MSDQLDGNASLELGRYARILRRRWRVVVLFGLLGLLAAGGYLLLRPSTYTSSSLVAVNVISTDPFNNTRNPSSLIDQQTEIQTARSSAVLGETAAALGNGVTRQDVKRSLTVELLADATVLRISYTGDSVAQAIDGAEEAGRNFLDYRGALAAQRITAINDQLTKRRDVLRDDLIRVNRQAARAASGSQAATQAESDRQLINTDLDSLATQITATNGIDTTGGTVLTSAEDNGAFVQPRRGLLLAGGLLGGLLLGLIACFVRNTLDRRLFDADDVRMAGGGPLLARLRAREETLPAASDDLDAVRSVWERLLSSMPEHDPVLAVADISSRKVPSEVALNLALPMCDAGRNVEVVLMEYPPDVVAQVVRLLDLYPVDTPGPITRLASHDHPGLTVSLLGEQGADTRTVDLLRAVLGDEGRAAEITVLALPPTVSRSARLAAGRLAHASLIIVAHKTSRGDVLHEMADELHAVRAGIAGTVMVPRGRRLHDDGKGRRDRGEDAWVMSSLTGDAERSSEQPPERTGATAVDPHAGTDEDGTDDGGADANGRHLGLRGRQ